MSIDDVLKCLQDDNVASQAWVERLQDATYNTDKQKYNQNYKYCQSCYDEGGFDGILGRNTRADIVHFLQDNPEALLDIGESLTQHLYDHGYGKALENVASSDTSLQDNLRAEIDCILDGRALSELDRDELKDVQTNWKLLGEYDGKIDGIIGKKVAKPLQDTPAQDANQKPRPPLLMTRHCRSHQIMFTTHHCQKILTHKRQDWAEMGITVYPSITLKTHKKQQQKVKPTRGLNHKLDKKLSLLTLGITPNTTAKNMNAG